MADRCSGGEVDGERKGAMEMVGTAGDAGGGEVEPIVGYRNLGYGVLKLNSIGDQKWRI